jgi:hypothetical protein
MKHLIKSLLRESLLSEAAENINTVTSTTGLFVTPDYLILYDYETDNLYGMIGYSKLDKDTYESGAIAGDKGFGPLLYELLMTKVYPMGLITDRYSTTSDSALNVLRGMYDRGLNVKTFSKDDDNYNGDKTRNEKDNIILNTVFKFEDVNTYNELLNRSETYLLDVKDKNKFLNNLVNRAFKLFKNKL